jgi:predicted enzyme involved in methoxymalonyl-ACP biosynthesis
MAALKRHASVTIIPWNYKIYPVINFSPDMFLDKDSGEFVDDKEIEKEITKQTSEQVFVAKVMEFSMKIH